MSEALLSPQCLTGAPHGPCSEAYPLCHLVPTRLPVCFCGPEPTQPSQQALLPSLCGEPAWRGTRNPALYTQSRPSILREAGVNPCLTPLTVWSISAPLTFPGAGSTYGTPTLPHPGSFSSPSKPSSPPVTRTTLQHLTVNNYRDLSPFAAEAASRF